VATKGPLSLAGNIELEGVNVSVEASVYIESENSNLALSIIGNSQIAGDVSVVNPLANVFLQGGQAGIGGETGQEAVDNHVSFGAPPSEFPEPNPDQFLPYASSVIDANTNTSADTSIEDNSGTNRLIFRGNVDSHPVSELPVQDAFQGLHDQTGTFAMVPGFHLSFGGSFCALCGAIAGNGIEFFGNAGGTINGSVINYSDEQMVLSGNSDLYFNRSGTTEVPAGFVPEIVLEYAPASYSEVVL